MFELGQRTCNLRGDRKTFVRVSVRQPAPGQRAGEFQMSVSQFHGLYIHPADRHGTRSVSKSGFGSLDFQTGPIQSAGESKLSTSQ